MAQVETERHKPGSSAGVQELRQIAHGLRPGALNDGLAAALRSLVRSSPLPVELDLDDITLPESVTTAVYYAAAEALANALKHSGADSVTITVRHGEESATLTVVDDGIGGAALGGGSGLTGIADRVATVGGNVRVHSPPGGGTSIEVTVPCGS